MKSELAFRGSLAISLAAMPTSAIASGRTITRLWSVASGLVKTIFTGWPTVTANRSTVNSIRSGMHEILTSFRCDWPSNWASDAFGGGSLIAVSRLASFNSRAIAYCGLPSQCGRSVCDSNAHRMA